MGLERGARTLLSAIPYHAAMPRQTRRSLHRRSPVPSPKGAASLSEGLAEVTRPTLVMERRQSGANPRHERGPVGGRAIERGGVAAAHSGASAERPGCRHPVQRPMRRNWHRHTTSTNAAKDENGIFAQLPGWRQRALAEPPNVQKLGFAFGGRARLSTRPGFGDGGNPWFTAPTCPGQSFV